jgi:GT2 family glycosyltransferase
MKVTVIFTCFNRKEKSLKCMQTLAGQDSGIEYGFIVVDDNSTDGTAESIKALDYHVELLHGSGSLYWAGGMRKGIEAYLESSFDSEYVLLVNDDVEFYEGIVDKMITESKEKKDAVIVGATCDDSGAFSYGAMQLIVPRKKDLYRQVSPAEGKVECDTFNCNCVLLNDAVIRKAGNFDPIYTHSLADIDYGLRLRKLGFHIYSSERYVGVCNKNSIRGTWADNSLSRKERLKKKESPKGAPCREWFHFMKKNFGFMEAVKYSVSPYVRIMLGM